MWEAKGWNEAGREVKVPFFAEVTEGSRQNIEAALRNSRSGWIPEAFARELRAEDPLPGIDGIESWGLRAAELVGPPKNGFGLVLVRDRFKTTKGTEIPALEWTRFNKPAALVFHFPEAIVADVSGLTEIEIYSESAGAMEPYRPFTRWQMSLEWRAYFGEGTLVCEEETSFGPPSGKRQSVRLRLLGCAGRLIGRFASWMGREDETHSLDPFRLARLKYFEEKHAALAKKCPDLGTYHVGPEYLHTELFCNLHGMPPDGPVVVFVHGTFACALPNLALLDPLPLPTYRFEHDTFKPITNNAEQLAKAIKEYFKPRPVHLVAHSRGGLVAYLAAHKLHQSGFSPMVRTYGTPHLGTPLANMAGRLFSFLLSTGRTAAGGVFSWDPPSFAAKLLMKSLTWSTKLPEGIAVMRTGAETLKSIRIHGDPPFPMLSYAGNYDLRTQPNGACAYALGEIIDGAFQGQNNDLVVPTTSAKGAGTPQPTFSPCSHFEYFCSKHVRDEINALGER